MEGVAELQLPAEMAEDEAVDGGGISWIKFEQKQQLLCFEVGVHPSPPGWDTKVICKIPPKLL